MAQLLILTATVEQEVLPALGLLSHRVRQIPAEASQLINAPTSDAMLVDGRRDVPREGVHALQIEVARPLYMDEERIERLPAMAALHADITGLIASLRRADWSFLR